MWGVGALGCWLDKEVLILLIGMVLGRSVGRYQMGSNCDAEDVKGSSVKVHQRPICSTCD